MIVKDGQSIFDIAVQEFGTMEELFNIIVDNSLTLNTKVVSGQELVVNKVDVGDENVKDFVTLKNITFNNNQGITIPPILAGDFNGDFNIDFS